MELFNGKVVKALSARARHAMAELTAEFRRKMNLGALVLTAPGYYSKLSQEYEDRVKAIVRDGMEDTANDRMVRVQCPICRRIEQIAGDVQRWQCSCTPVERLAFQTYVRT